MKFYDWHTIVERLAHSIQSVALAGWLRKKDFPVFQKAIDWCNEWSEDFEDGKPIKIGAYDRNERCLWKTVPKGQFDCLSVDILFVLVYARELEELFKLEPSDWEILEPVVKRCEQLIPWIKYEQ